MSDQVGNPEDRFSHNEAPIEMMYKLYEEHPDLLYIERRLQVMCFNLRCHPLWLPNFRNEKIHNEFDFIKDAYAVHFTQPLPKSFKSRQWLGVRYRISSLNG